VPQWSCLRAMTENSPNQTASPAAATFSSLDTLAFANGKPEFAATFKQKFTDFRVDEHISFTFTEKASMPIFGSRDRSIHFGCGKELSEILAFMARR